MISFEELAQLDECPCEICTSQDTKEKIPEMSKIDEICDLIADQMIDYLIENPNKDILKELSEKTKLKEDE